MQIRRSVFYRGHLISGPSAVLVSIQFGTTPTSGPRVVRVLAEGKQDAVPRFDVEKHVREIVAGVDMANREQGGSLQVAMVEVVPDDSPSEGQARFLAYQIALAVLRGEVRDAT
jgi:hypothetical protein